jgi:thiol-disulfide isomerase/thioredoxin
MPSLAGAELWLNSPPLEGQQLKGKVVLVDFWTYDCINCRRSLPHVNDWARRYADQGLVVVGVHTPEYDYEHDVASLREQVNRLGIGYPVAVDNGYRIWNAWGNQFWPAHYFVDRKGRCAMCISAKATTTGRSGSSGNCSMSRASGLLAQPLFA